MLRFFGIEAASFAVAGAFVLFILAVEMTLGREIIKNGGARAIFANTITTKNKEVPPKRDSLLDNDPGE